MRCRPGDVAMVTGKAGVSCGATSYDIPFGTPVTVVALVGSGGIWNLAEPVILQAGPLGVFQIDGIADSCLTPYRPWEPAGYREPVARPVELDVAWG